METPDELLQLIAHLQHNSEGDDARRTLLKYIARSSGARLALLFACDDNCQVLKLLASYGRRPRQHAQPVERPQPTGRGLPSSSPGCGSPSAPTMDEGGTSACKHGRGDGLSSPFNPKQISLHGLFGSALGTTGLLHIPDLFADTASQEEERYWAWRGGPVLLGAVGQGTNTRGVLVLCFGSRDEWQASSMQTRAGESNLHICIALLSGYLTRVHKKAQQPRIAEQQDGIQQERARIARDIHDGPAQSIAHVLHKLEFIERVLEKQPQVALQELSKSRRLLEETLRDLRHGVLSPVPLQLEERDFTTALQRLLDEHTASETGFTISFDSTQVPVLPPVLEVPIFRFIQEALNNVYKHAHASHVTVSIRVHVGLLVVEVSDNGQGFSVEQVLHSAYAGQHSGLRGMRTRIQQARGMWEVQSTPGGGTAVKARFPLASPAQQLTSREREVLQLLIEGATNRVIAGQLSVSIETVKSHVRHIMQKMQARDRTQAAVIATKEQWIL